MGAHEKPLCKISMFLAGFIFFTPHRIAITCANHVMKRYHLPLGTVAMFVYRLHNLMELGSFAGTVINTAIKLSTTALSDDNKTMLKNCVSGISIWTMLLWSIITYFSFIAGGEYGYFGEFFWNIVILVFIYGVYSNSAMGIEGLNAPFYIVGLPLFGLVTFLFHKLYKYLYYIYFWDEYDYVIVLYQIWIMMILSLATSIVWTVARVMDTHESTACVIGVDVDISQALADNNTGTDGGFYRSGGVTIQVEKITVPGGSNNWRCYKHSRNSSGTFTLKNITHSDVTMEGGGLNDNMSKTFTQVTAVYVYYKSLNQMNEPKVICIVENSGTKHWYKAGRNVDNWTKVTTALKTKNPSAATGSPTAVTQKDLDDATAGTINPQGENYVIKLDKIPKEVGPTKKIKYRTNGTHITVERKDGAQAGPVPNGYVRYKHEGSISNPKFRHNGFTLEGINVTEPVQAIYVYYTQSGDDNHEFPLIVCIDTGQKTTWKYYKRGNKWMGNDNELYVINPDDPQIAGLTTLTNKLGDVKDKYEVKIEKTNDHTPYTARPKKPNHQISVSPLTENSGFKGYRHPIPDTSKKINYISIHNQPIEGITQVENGDGFQVTTANGGVFVYYSASGDEKLRRPYLICLSERGTNTGTNIWYKRQKKGVDQDGYTWVNADSDYPNKDPNKINEFATKLDGIKCELTKGDKKDTGYTPLAVNSNSKPQPSGLSLLFGADDDGRKYHIIHWSPIFLVALSLGTVYAFYPAISPYQLVDDPFDGKKIELWIQAISATPHIAFAITQICKKGPGRLWTNYVYECDKYKLYALYHATWLFFIPYIICIYIFFSMMHFPDGRIGKYFRGNVFRTGVLCVVFAWVQEFMEAVGFGGGMGAQVSGKCGDDFNDDAGTIFGFMFLVFMTVSMFTEDLYFLIRYCQLNHCYINCNFMYGVNYPYIPHIQNFPP